MNLDSQLGSLYISGTLTGKWTVRHLPNPKIVIPSHWVLWSKRVSCKKGWVPFLVPFSHSSSPRLQSVAFSNEQKMSSLWVEMEPHAMRRVTGMGWLQENGEPIWLLRKPHFVKMIVLILLSFYEVLWIFSCYWSVDLFDLFNLLLCCPFTLNICPAQSCLLSPSGCPPMRKESVISCCSLSQLLRWDACGTAWLMKYVPIEGGGREGLF